MNSYFKCFEYNMTYNMYFLANDKEFLKKYTKLWGKK